MLSSIMMILAQATPEAPTGGIPEPATGGDSIFVFPWYSWVALVGIVVVLLVYKLYKDKMMT